MYLKKSKYKSGRIYLSIVDNFYDREKKHARTVTVKPLGYLDVLEKEYEDPIAHFTEEVKCMNEEKAADKAPFTFSCDKLERIDSSTENRKNLGYAAISKIYHQLEIDTFLINRQRHSKEEFDANAIMKLLIFSRLLCPASKKSTYENKEMYFEKMDFSLDDVYRALTLFNKRGDELQLWLNEKVKKLYNRNTELVYYDVTNFYFEIEEADDLRKKGVSKEHRPDPIVQMGLFVDTSGLPISYKIFSGNTLDKQTFIPALKEVQHDYDLGRIIVVADKGMTTGDNIWYTLSAKNGYVLSFSIRGAEQTFKNYVLDEKGYRSHGDGGFKIKSRPYPRQIFVTSKSGKKMKKIVDEKQIVFFSPKYAAKAKFERKATIEKAKKLINSPSMYNRSTSYGAAKYVKNLSFDKKTGEIIQDAQNALLFDEEKLKQEEALDGYYAIVTSEMDESDERIIEIYRGLWKIEESFRVTKSELEARPVYLSTEGHIKAHFLTCFISLLIARILENQTKGKHSVGKILESLSKACGTHIQENIYIFDHFDEVLSDIGEALEIDFSRKYLKLGEIKKILAATKKG